MRRGIRDQASLCCSRHYHQVGASGSGHQRSRRHGYRQGVARGLSPRRCRGSDEPDFASPGMLLGLRRLRRSAGIPPRIGVATADPTPVGSPQQQRGPLGLVAHHWCTRSSGSMHQHRRALRGLRRRHPWALRARPVPPFGPDGCPDAHRLPCSAAPRIPFRLAVSTAGQGRGRVAPRPGRARKRPLR